LLENQQELKLRLYIICIAEKLLENQQEFKRHERELLTLDGSAEAKKVKDRILALHEQRKNVCSSRRFRYPGQPGNTWCTGRAVSQWEGG
jgi:hypothetical protein